MPDQGRGDKGRGKMRRGDARTRVMGPEKAAYRGGLRIPEHPLARSDGIRSRIPGDPVSLGARVPAPFPVPIGRPSGQARREPCAARGLLPCTAPDSRNARLRLCDHGLSVRAVATCAPSPPSSHRATRPGAPPHDREAVFPGGERPFCPCPLSDPPKPGGPVRRGRAPGVLRRSVRGLSDPPAAGTAHVGVRACAPVPAIAPAAQAWARRPAAPARRDSTPSRETAPAPRTTR